VERVLVPTGARSRGARHDPDRRPVTRRAPRNRNGL